MIEAILNTPAETEAVKLLNGGEMTVEDFRKCTDSLEDETSVLRKCKQQLLTKLLSQSPYKRGDKVVVTAYGKEVTCFVSKVKWGYNFYNYDFAKMKKDGTMAEVSAGIYSFTKIRRAE